MTTSNIYSSTTTTDSIKVRMYFSGTNGDTADGASLAIYSSYSSSSPMETKSSSFTETDSETEYFTFYGLDPDTTYYFEGSFTLGGGLDGTYPTERDGYSTDAPPSPSVSISRVSETDTTLEVESSFSSSYYETDALRFYLYQGSTQEDSKYLSFSSDRSSSNNGVTWGSLQPDTQYKVRVRYYQANGSESWYDDVYITTDPPPTPSVNISSSTITHDTVELESSFYSSYFDTDGVRFYIYLNGSEQNNKYISLSDRNSSDNGVTWGSLDPNTQYMFRVRYYQANGSSSWYDDVYVTTDELSRPTSFSWDYTKTSGSEFYLTASEWNNFCGRINSFREYKGLSSDSFTTAHSGNNVTASIFNEAKDAIDDMNPPTSTPSSAYTGNDATAYKFNRIVDALNSIN